MSPRMSVKLAPTIPVVVESDVLGRTAFSVPTHQERGEVVVDGRLNFYVEADDIHEAIEHRETAYLDSLEDPNEEVEIDKQTLSRAAEWRVLTGDLTWDSLAAKCGWTREDNEYTTGRRGDGQRVRALLSGETKRNLTYDEATALVKALELDPVDIGL